MTPIETQLNEISQRADAATAGPIRVEGPYTCQRELNSDKDRHYAVFDENCGNLAHVFKKADAEFLAAARADVPKLVAALRYCITHSNVNFEDLQTILDRH